VELRVHNILLDKIQATTDPIRRRTFLEILTMFKKQKFPKISTYLMDQKVDDEVWRRRYRDLDVFYTYQKLAHGQELLILLDIASMQEMAASAASAWKEMK